MEWSPLILTFKLALVTTVILFLISVPLAYWLARIQWKIKPVIEAIVSMPLVLPPTVIGFYFLLAFSPGNFFGSWLNDWFGVKLVFSFPGLVVASVIYSLPFMLHPIKAGLTNLPGSIYEASILMGKSKFETLLKVQLPNMTASIITGAVLAFAHTVGEFGVVLMIGGNIPGKTKVASIAIYDEVEALNYDAANFYSMVLFGATFLILLGVYILNGGYVKRFWK